MSIPLHLRRFILLFVSFLLLSQNSLLAQQQYRFSWLSKDKKQQVGILGIALEPGAGADEFSILLTVRWFNSQGLELNQSIQKPFLYLSEYDYQIKPVGTLTCKTFADPAAYQIYFQDDYAISFEVKKEVNGDFDISFLFQYAFSEADIAIGRIHKLEFETEELTFSFDASLVSDQNSDVGSDQRTEDIRQEQIIKTCHNADSCLNAFLRKRDRLRYTNDTLGLETELSKLVAAVAEADLKDSIQIAVVTASIMKKKESAETFIEAIDQVLSTVNPLRSILTSGLLPIDSSSQYMRRMDNARRELRSMQNDYVDYGTEFRELLNELGIQNQPVDMASKQEFLLENYQSLFQVQLDSLIRIREMHAVLLLSLEPELYQPPAKAIENPVIDSLTPYHNMLKAQMGRLKERHQEGYLEYLSRIGENGSIQSIDDVHDQFISAYDIGKASFDRIDEQIRLLNEKVLELTSRNDYRVLWYGGGALFIIIVFFIIQQFNRRSRIDTSYNFDPAKSNGIRKPSGGLDAIEEEANTNTDYYPFSPAKIVEPVVAEVQFSFRAIKAINQLVQGAISRKDPLDFGGFLFGRQYKATGTSLGLSIIMVDFTVSSDALRYDMQFGIAGGQDLVDELDKVVGDNKKSVLLGWFSGTGNTELEMSESLIKTHRTFFREKWQIALLLNPGTEGLMTGVFLRRKTGFFEQIPDPKNRVNWEDLYQYVLNPPIGGSILQEVTTDPADYISVELNQNWCDSIVQQVCILPEVLINLRRDRKGLVSSPSSSLAAGFFYGSVKTFTDEDQIEYNVFINRFVEITNGETPRDIPGFNLLGALYLLDQEIFASLKQVIPLHQSLFEEPYQVCVIVNVSTNELRIFSRKHSLEMNNNVIETEQFNLNELVRSALKSK